MMERIKAWWELLKLGNVSQIRKELNAFFRGNVIRVLKEEGWFEFLKVPRSAEEILEQFNYEDEAFLDEVLDTLCSDNTLRRLDGNKYRFMPPLDETWVVPRIFTESMVDIWKNYASAIPDRLRGQYLEFTSGINLFNWDDVLTHRLYEQIRRASFAFSKALQRSGKFLDIGCGNGFGTAAIWAYYFKKGCISRARSEVEIVGIDPDESLLDIARDEFPRHLMKHLKRPRKELETFAPVYPQFMKGSATAIPFEDETFDIVYASQVLHWTDAEQAVAEMLRVTKPGGIVFGTENFYPRANRYNNLHFLVVRKARGFFHQDDRKQWALQYGARTVEFSTPISVFVIKK